MNVFAVFALTHLAVWPLVGVAAGVFLLLLLAGVFEGKN